MITIDLSSFIANSTSPKYDPTYPLGNRTNILGTKLAAGHFLPQEYAMTAVHPRPDAETGSYAGTVTAKHRWAYYDGTNPIQYEVAIKVQGGSAPFRFRINSAPGNATLEAVYGDPTRHGVFKWTPSQAYTTGSPAAISVTCIGQDDVELDITWTVATSSSTAQFIFVSTTGNDSTGTGTISAPFASMAKIFGATTVTTTYPGRSVYVRAGSYSLVAHSDSWLNGANETIRNRLVLTPSHHPNSILSYPGENVTIDMSGAQFDLSGNDFSICGSTTGKLIFSGSATNAMERWNFWLNENNQRTHFAFVDFDGFIPKTDSGFTNSAPIFAPTSNSTPTRRYISCHNVREINRTATFANDGLLWVLFGVRYWVDEYCSGSRTGGPGTAFKDTCYDTSTRYMDVSADTDQFTLAIMCQNGGGNSEVCYSRINGSLWFNLQAYTGAIGKIVEYRNSVRAVDTNYQQGVRAWGTPGGHGVWKSMNSVVMSNGPSLVNSEITATGTECHVVNSSNNKPINLTTLNLVDVSGGTAYRSLYLGTRGWEIA